MIILSYFDYFGPLEELAENLEKVKAVCAEMDGIKFKGQYVPHSRKYHFVRMFEADSYQKFLEMLSKGPPRDRKKTTHGEMEILTEPISR